MKIFKNNERYSIVENQIIDEINKDPITFLNLNLMEYSKKINCSKSAISRMVKILNFNSIFQMKLFVHEKMIFDNLFYNINQNQTTQSRINNIKSYNNYAINKTIENLNLKSLKLAVSKIIEVKKIHIFGVGSSYLAAYEFTNNLLKINFSASCSQDIHNSILILGNFNKNDLVILFSKSGKTKEILYLIDECSKQGIQIILITSNVEFKNNNNLVTIIHEEITKNERIIATSSKISQLIISDILFYEIFFSSSKNGDFVDNSLISLRNWKKFQ